MERRRAATAVAPVRLFLALIACIGLVLGLWSGPLPSPRAAEGLGDRAPRTIAVAGRTLQVAFDPGDFQLPGAAILGWVEKSARAVAAYYGRFPVPAARIEIVAARGRGVVTGRTFGYRGGLIRIGLAPDADANDLARDWVMVHEMIHLALPDVDDQHDWLAEGLATYVESIARARAGDLTQEAAWGDIVSGMPRGLPAAGDRGLDLTPTWGRTYWGGAMFCLLGDMAIRQETGNRLGLQDAMRGVLDAGGTLLVHWPIRRVLEEADKATGTRALSRLYEEMRASPVRPDLVKLWRELGIRAEGRRIAFDDDAPLAPIRRAISIMARDRHG